MNIDEYAGVLRKRWVTIAVVTTLGLALAIAATLLLPQKYAASARMFFSVEQGGSLAELQSGSAYTEQVIYSYAELVSSPIVLQPVIEDLGLDVTVVELAEDLEVTVPTGTVILEIAAHSGSAQQAADIANAVVAEMAAITSELTPGQVVESRVIESALLPMDPISPRPLANIALGLLGGLALGVGLAVLREVTNTKVRTEQDVASVTDAVVIGTVGHDKVTSTHQAFVHEVPGSAPSEAIRQVRTNLQFIGPIGSDDRHASIVITSSMEGEGKTTTAINLALSLAAAGSRVLLVDADLRQPAVAPRLGLEGGAGLSTTLIGKNSVADVTQTWGHTTLDVLPSGVVPPNPSELLASKRMSRLLAELTQVYDVVLLDSPPLVEVADAAALSRLTSGAIVVAGADRLRKANLRRALNSLKTVDARVLGIVLNKARWAQPAANSSYVPANAPRIPAPARHALPDPDLAKELTPLRARSERAS